MEGAAHELSAAESGRGQKRSLRGLARLFGYLAPYRLRIAGAVVALVAAAAMVLSLGVGVQYLIDGGFGAGRPQALDHALAAVLIVVLVLAVATYARSYLVTWLGERVVADLRRDVYRHLMTLSPGFFEITRTGEVLSRLTTDTSVIQTVIGASVSQALRNILLLVGGLAMLVVTDPRLSGLILLVVPLVVVPLVVVGRQVRKRSRTAQDRTADVSAIAAETLDAVRTVQAFTQEGYETRRFTGATEAAFRAAAGYAQARGLMGAIIIALVFGAIGVVLWLGGHDVLSGRITAGQLSSFVFFAATVASAVGGLSDIAGDLQRAAGATERLMELMATRPLILAPASPRAMPAIRRGGIRLEDVSFAYPTRPESGVLEHLSLEVRPGETVALVGPSGAGKTTLLQLLLRFYDPSAGRVLMDGLPLAEVDPEELRRGIGLVAQEPVIFSADAWTNIRYGRPEADDAAVRAAADAAAALDFVEALPHGFGTFLGEKGVRLSGGQRQRIAIARAILRDPALLLLDEATSALDAENERLVQLALERLMRDRTCVVVAHRLATVQKADRIVVIDEGRIVEQGRHDELVRRGGLYARLAELQFTGVEAVAA